MASDRYGIDDRFHDAHGVEHVTSAETRVALLAATHEGAGRAVQMRGGQCECGSLEEGASMHGGGVGRKSAEKF